MTFFLPFSQLWWFPTHINLSDCNSVSKFLSCWSKHFNFQLYEQYICSLLTSTHFNLISNFRYHLNCHFSFRLSFHKMVFIQQWSSYLLFLYHLCLLLIPMKLRSVINEDWENLPCCKLLLTMQVDQQINYLGIPISNWEKVDTSESTDIKDEDLDSWESQLDGRCLLLDHIWCMILHSILMIMNVGIFLFV